MNRREVLAGLAATPLLSRFGGAEELGAKGAALHAAPPAALFGKVAMETIAVIAAHVLPGTPASPAADGAEVAAFADRFTADSEPAFQEELTGDLARLDRLALGRHEKLFVRLPADAREKLLAELDAADPAKERAARGFRTLRILTVFAHYTSEKGQRFGPHSGAYEGCTHPEHKR